MDSIVSESTLLCESCGYVLEGLSFQGNCPECGAPIAHSLPERRVGSEWQKRASLRAWLRTSWSALTRPRLLFSTVVIDAASAERLLRINLWAAALAIGLTYINLIGYVRSSHVLAALGASLLLVALASALAYGVLWVLTRIEFGGIQFFGARRSWRINEGVASVICAHAAVGWVLGALGMLCISFFWGTHWAPTASWSTRSTTLVHYTVWVPSIAAVFLAGLFVFEILVYIGVRECRYANPPGAGRAATSASDHAAGAEEPAG